MSREIKFRGKSINTGEWVESMTISKGTIKRKSNNYFMELSDGKWIGVFPDSVGQFTGLTDKNGKEIYEGDCDAVGNVVECINGCFSLNGDRPLSMMLNVFEVSGNIYERTKPPSTS